MALSDDRSQTPIPILLDREDFLTRMRHLQRGTIVIGIGLEIDGVFPDGPIEILLSFTFNECVKK